MLQCTIAGEQTKGANERSFVFVHQHGGDDVNMATIDVNKLLLFFFYFGKKACPSSICKRFLFPESSDPQGLLIPKVTRDATIGTPG